MPKYSFVVPIYNDAYLGDSFCCEFRRVMSQVVGESGINQEVELLFVNDGSAAGTFDTLRELSHRYPFVRVIDLSRNFGQHIALSCGYKYAKGDYVGMLNVDMQDPPDQIPLLIETQRRENADIVIGVRNQRHSSWSERWTSLAFGWVLNLLTGKHVPLNTATLRIMNRRFVDAYNQLTEHHRYLPGLESWLGFHHFYCPIRHQARADGRTSYTLKKRWAMAFDSIVSFSDLPLRIGIVVGGTIAVLGFVSAIVVIIQKLFFRDLLPGYTSLFSLIMFIGGIQILLVGLAGIYIGRILREVQNRPLYLVRETVNL